MDRPLGEPQASILTAHLASVTIDPSMLFRISSHSYGEPYFGATGGNRFDDPDRSYGVCYLGLSLDVAFGESILHNISPTNNAFSVAHETLNNRFVHHFDGPMLRVFDLSGPSLSVIGGTLELFSTGDYPLAQRWSAMIHRHPTLVDGFIYSSRLVPAHKAVALFNRGAGTEMEPKEPIPLRAHPDFPGVMKSFSIQEI